MIAAGLLLLQAAFASPPPAPFVPAAQRDAVPTDWSILPALPYANPPHMTAAYSRYVADEIAAGRCALVPPADGRWAIRLDVAVLVDGAGAVRRLVPRAMGCPTVEQFGAGLVQNFARGNLSGRATTPQWYRASVVFEWNA